MKRILSCFLVLLFSASFIWADGLSSILSKSKGLQVNIYLKSYTPTAAGSGYSNWSVTLHGTVIDCNDEILTIHLDKESKRDVPTDNTPANIYIRVPEIAAVQIEDKK